MYLCGSSYRSSPAVRWPDVPLQHNRLNRWCLDRWPPMQPCRCYGTLPVHANRRQSDASRALRSAFGVWSATTASHYGGAMHPERTITFEGREVRYQLRDEVFPSASGNSIFQRLDSAVWADTGLPLESDAFLRLQDIVV